jgi:transposase
LARKLTEPVQDRARVINRVQAVLEEAHIKLASVVTDVRGVSARAMLEALIAGHRDVTALADPVRGRLRTKRAQLEAALQGYFTPHQSFLLTEYFSQMDYFDDAIAHISVVIAQRLEAEQEAMALLDTIPGVSQRTAEILLAEIGTDMTRFPSATHLASWAGMCPGHYDSGGKRLSGRTRKGSRWLRQVPVEAAQYQRIAARRGKQRALIALGHTILVMLSTFPQHLAVRRPSTPAGPFLGISPIPPA